MQRFWLGLLISIPFVCQMPSASHAGILTDNSSVFPACENTPAESSVPSDQQCSDLLEKLSITGLNDARDAANAIVLMHEAAGVYKRNLNINIKFYRAILNCFSGDNSKDCSEYREGFQKNLKTSYVALRRELAQAIGNSPIISSSSVPEAHLNMYMQSFNHLSSAGTDHELDKDSDEYKTALADFEKDRADVKSAIHSPADLMGEWTKKADEHRGRYLLELVKNPHFMYLSAPTGNPLVWSDKQIQKALQSLIADASSELPNVNRVLQSDKLEFDRFDMEDLYKGAIKGEMSLLDFVEYPGVMNEALKKHPGLCSLAIRLHQKYKIKDLENTLLVQGAITAATGGVGKIAQFLGRPLIGALAVAQVSKVISRAAMGGNMLYSAQAGFSGIEKRLMGDVDATLSPTDSK